MKINQYILYCEKCRDFVPIDADNVDVTLDLKRDMYEFRAECPKCGIAIYNSRKCCYG